MMTSKDEIWKRANAANAIRCIALLERIFPSMASDAIIESGSVSSVEKVSTKERALEKIRLGLQSITETEAKNILLALDEKKPQRSIKF
jgi:hypothetical protein